MQSMHTLQNASYVQTGDDTVHPIAHTGDVPWSTKNGKEKYLADVLHVPNITKNLVSVGQMVEQGLQVTFNDVEIWHKGIGHANVQRLKLMQSKELVTGLPQFRVSEMQQVCAACQLGKQAKEPKNRHIAEVARALMSEKNMPPCYWAEASSTAVYTMNMTPTATVHDMTPEEKLTRKKPDVSHFKVFGCIAYVHVPDELRMKLESKAEKCVFIGYSIEHKGYKYYNPVKRQVRVSKDVVFDEMATWYTDMKDDIAADVNKSLFFNCMWSKG
ncbi:hypothetical protein L7F22_021399 [Adiantum nelumboides]|nr:hypothetical protein [Adiantum nelumboides]